MIRQEHYEHIAHILPILHFADPPMVRAFQQTAFFATIPTGKDIFIEGSPPDAIALLL